LAHKNAKVPEGGKLVSVEGTSCKQISPYASSSPLDIVRDHWKQFGRNYYSRYDYEEVESAAAEKVMKAVQETQVGLVGKQVIPGFTVSLADNFQYKDLKENAITRNQVSRCFLCRFPSCYHWDSRYTELCVSLCPPIYLRSLLSLPLR
jgi:hypothetical protein